MCSTCSRSPDGLHLGAVQRNPEVPSALAPGPSMPNPMLKTPFLSPLALFAHSELTQSAPIYRLRFKMLKLSRENRSVVKPAGQWHN